jgi:hypothetical protein
VHERLEAAIAAHERGATRREMKEVQHFVYGDLDKGRAADDDVLLLVELISRQELAVDRWTLEDLQVHVLAQGDAYPQAAATVRTWRAAGASRKTADKRSERDGFVEIAVVDARDREYQFVGVGTLALHGVFSRSATATAGATRWEFQRRGGLVTRPSYVALDAAGARVGEFSKGVFTFGSVRWEDRTLTIGSAVTIGSRYVFDEDGQELALIESNRWAQASKRVMINPNVELDPGLLLFAAFVAYRIPRDANPGV